jgi:two-component system, OmpR family, sensor kinase
MWAPSLRLRLTLLVGLLTGGTLLLFALVFYLVLRANLFNEVDAQLRDRAALMSRVLADQGGPVAGVTLPAPSALVEFAAPGIYVELVAPDGKIRALSSNLPFGPLPADPALIDAARAGSSSVGTVTTAGGEQLRVLVKPVPATAPPGTLLVVAESIEPPLRVLAEARALLLILGGLALLLAVGAATLLTGRALAPIARITRAAADVAATGHYHERVPAPRRSDEVGQLAATMNELIGTVERTLAQQRQFLADTSHELRSPLTVVLANLDLMRRELDPHEHDLSVVEATAEAQRMRRLVNDLLLLAHADAGQMIAHAPVRLDQLVEQTVPPLARQARDHHVEVQVAKPLVVIGDQERLTQLLRNLLENALHHTPPGTSVMVRLRRADGLAQLVVADSGPGIAPEHLPYIWDRFYRTDKARSREFGDTGLGLSIVKYIAEAHQGGVSVASEEGRGTTFTIVLPLADASGQYDQRRTTTDERPTTNDHRY